MDDWGYPHDLGNLHIQPFPHVSSQVRKRISMSPRWGVPPYVLGGRQGVRMLKPMILWEMWVWGVLQCGYGGGLPPSMPYMPCFSGSIRWESREHCFKPYIWCWNEASELPHFNYPWFNYPIGSMYGRLMLTKLGFLLMVNVTMIIAYMDPMAIHGFLIFLPKCL